MYKVCKFFQLGLVCFRLVGGPDEKPEQVDDLNKKLLTNINASGKLHMVPANVMDRFVIRFCVVQQHATREDIGKFFNDIYNNNYNIKCNVLAYIVPLLGTSLCLL